ISSSVSPASVLRRHSSIDKNGLLTPARHRICHRARGATPSTGDLYPMNKTIRIINPKPGSQRNTSSKRAEKFVRRGLAVLRDGELFFWEDQRVLDMRKEAETQARFESAVGLDRIIGWNGSDRRPFVRHRPGIKCS